MGADGDDKYSRNFWVKQWKTNPELLLFAKDEDRVCGMAICWVDGNGVTVAMDGILESYSNKGLHEALFVEVEKRAKKLNCAGIVLGIDEGKEEFYAKLGYVGKMLIQSEKYSVDELKTFNAQHGNYEITGTNVYEGYIHQLWLNVSLLDKTLKNTYENTIGDCWVQIVVSKEL
jgi:GNAT superfamily N-acetyltransferase